MKQQKPSLRLRILSATLRHVPTVSALLCASILAQPVALQAQFSEYTATVIKLGDSVKSTGYGINDHGEVVGSIVSVARGPEQAFLYSGGSITLLGTLGGINSVAYDINNSGQIVGHSQESDKAYTAFLYSGGQMTGLGRPPHRMGTDGENPAKSSKAVAINDSGQIAIESSAEATNRPSGFIYHSGEATPRMEAIPYLDRFGQTPVYNLKVGDINNHGTTVGDSPLWMADSSSSSGETQIHRLFIYSNGSHQEVKSLPEYGYDHTYSLRFLEAKGINDDGTVLGISSSNNVERSFIFNPAQHEVPIELGTLRGPHEGGWADSTSAEAINNFGQVVGTSDHNTDTYFKHAFIYQDGTMSDLNNLVTGTEDVTFTTAYAINNWGQIVAQGTGTDGATYAYLLNPTSFLTFASEDGSALNIRAIAGMEYSAYEAPEAPAGSFAAAIIGGTAGGQRDVHIIYTGENVPGGLGEVIDLHGTEGDLFVLEIGFDPALAETHDPSTLTLGWLDPEDGMWKNAIDGNSSGEGHFVLGAFDADEHLQLGYYGVDLDKHTVWAVLDHNSSFGVIPEPSTWAFLLLGGIGLAAYGRRTLAMLR